MSEDILKMLDAIQNKSYNDANEIFNDLIGQKLDQALEQEKVSVAASIFGNDEDIPLDDDDVEAVLDDDDVEAVVDETEESESLESEDEEI